jgi:hypothetical protein
MRRRVTQLMKLTILNAFKGDDGNISWCDDNERKGYICKSPCLSFSFFFKSVFNIRPRRTSLAVLHTESQ